jgi:hypothetical protein
MQLTGQKRQSGRLMISRKHDRPAEKSHLVRRCLECNLVSGHNSEMDVMKPSHERDWENPDFPFAGPPVSEPAFNVFLTPSRRGWLNTVWMSFVRPQYRFRELTSTELTNGFVITLWGRNEATFRFDIFGLKNDRHVDPSTPSKYRGKSISAISTRIFPPQRDKCDVNWF